MASPQRSRDLQAKLDEQGWLVLRDVIDYLEAFHPVAAKSHPVIYRMAAKGQIDAIRYGGTWRVTKEELERYVKFGNKEVPQAAVGSPGPKAKPIPTKPMTARELIQMGRRYDQEPD